MLLLIVVTMGGAVLILLAYLGQTMTNTTLVQSIELQARTHNFAEDALRNADVLEGMGMSQTFVDRWHEQWIGSMRPKSSVSSDRDAKLTSMSRAVRLLIQIFLLGAGALLILNLQATGGAS